MTIYAQAKPVYQPAMRLILSITNSFPAVIVTSLDGVTPANNDYQTGTIVRLDIPRMFGMIQANQQTGTVTVINPTTFSINIDTTFYDPFIIPSKWPFSQQAAQVVPVGEINSLLTAATQNVL